MSACSLVVYFNGRLSLRRTGLKRCYVAGAKLTHCYAERGQRQPGHASLVFVHGLSGSKDNWNSIVDVRAIRSGHSLIFVSHSSVCSLQSGIVSCHLELGIWDCRGRGISGALETQP